MRLPPAGPAWYPTVMGTGILATLLQLHAGVLGPAAGAAAVALLVLAWTVLVVLTTLFAARVVRDPGVLRASVADRGVLPLWGTVAMGLLAVGSATFTVVPPLSPSLRPVAVHVDASLWGVGTLLGLATALGFTTVLVRERPGPPTLVWGLPIVPPMVSATTGAALVPEAPGATGQMLLLAVTLGCFALALTLGVVVFGVGYHHHWRRTPLDLAASPSAWIPLGIVGQSTAAAQAIATAAAPSLTPAAARAGHLLADGYGVVVLTVGLPLVVWAVLVTVRGFRARMPFTPGWWALTFPVGTLALGAHLLGVSLGSPLVLGVGLAFVATLCATWTMCTVAGIRAVVRDARRPRVVPAVARRARAV